MNTSFAHLIASFLVATSLLQVSASAQNRVIRYSVTFNDNRVADQSVTIQHADELTTVETRFEAILPVFLARHAYSESLSATVRADGAVERFSARINDNSQASHVVGEIQEDGSLLVVRTDPAGKTESILRREDYDFHSLAIYGNAPTNFLPGSPSARVLDVATGTVIPYELKVNQQSETTRERQHVVSTLLTWNDGHFQSRSWHPERFSNLPSRYIRDNRHGRFTFVLQR
jgi:hypothetical protein